MNFRINTRMVHQSFTLRKSNFFKAIRKLAIICVSNEGLTEVDSYSLSMLCTACRYSVTARVQEKKNLPRIIDFNTLVILWRNGNGPCL